MGYQRAVQALLLPVGRGAIAAPLSCRGWRWGPCRFLKTYWDQVLYTAVGSAGENASDYVTPRFKSITLYPMKKILLILNISVLAITARGSLVLVSGTGGNTTIQMLPIA